MSCLTSATCRRRHANSPASVSGMPRRKANCTSARGACQNGPGGAVRCRKADALSSLEADETMFQESRLSCESLELFLRRGRESRLGPLHHASLYPSTHDPPPCLTLTPFQKPPCLPCHVVYCKGEGAHITFPTLPYVFTPCQKPPCRSCYVACKKREHLAFLISVTSFPSIQRHPNTSHALSLSLTQPYTLRPRPSRTAPVPRLRLAGWAPAKEAQALIKFARYLFLRICMPPNSQPASPPSLRPRRPFLPLQQRDERPVISLDSPTLTPVPVRRKMEVTRPPGMNIHTQWICTTRPLLT